MSAVGRIKINSIYVLVAIMTIAILLYTRSFVHPYRIASLYLHDGERHGGEEEGRGRAAATAVAASRERRANSSWCVPVLTQLSIAARITYTQQNSFPLPSIRVSVITPPTLSSLVT